MTIHPNPPMMILKKIISGGQTGADRGGLEAGKELELETGGWVPRGFLTERGPDLSLKDLGCTETSSTRYPPRTYNNVRDSSGTLIVGSSTSPGCRLTIKYCRELNRPWKVVAFQGSVANVEKMLERGIADVKFFLDIYDIATLNVAGNRESKNPGIQEFTKKLLVQSLSRKR